jgi:hypothetical protein
VIYVIPVGVLYLLRCWGGMSRFGSGEAYKFLHVGRRHLIEACDFVRMPELRASQLLCRLCIYEPVRNNDVVANSLF